MGEKFLFGHSANLEQSIIMPKRISTEMVHEHNGPQNSAKRMRNLKAKSASDPVITNSLRHKATPGLDKNLLR